MVNPPPDPELSLYTLMAYYLRFLRLKHKMTQTEVGQIINCTKGQVSKYEGGTRQLDERACAALDQAWNTGGLFTILLRFAKQGVDPNWHEILRKYLRGSTILRFFYNNVIPIPFQTEGYARCLLEVGHDAQSIDDVELEVTKRMEEQEAILASKPLIWTILDQVAFRPMGPTSVMEEQRDLILKLAQHRDISIRVIPGEALPHMGVDGGFTHFELRNGRQAAFAGTSLNVGRVIDDQSEVARVAVHFERIAARSWSESQSLEWISRMCT